VPYQDLFAGAAPYYRRFRPAYPDGAFELLRSEFDLDGTGTLLDLGCGTGQAAIPLAGDFAKVVALDLDVEMLAEGREAAAAAGIDNIGWVEGAAESSAASHGKARLVTAGNAFHWMDRDRVLAALTDVVDPRGGVAILAGGSVSLWHTRAAWAAPVREVIQRYLGSGRRAGRGHFVQPAERHEEVCARSAFPNVETHVFPVERRWSYDQFVGALYSTSYCSPTVLGDRQRAFETELRETLARAVPEGEIVHNIAVDAILARRT